MNSLDRAFIRAYARDVDVETLGSTINATPLRRRDTKPDAAVQPLVQVSYADGSWYRVEQRAQPAANVPAPHVRYSPDTQPPAKPEPPKPTGSVPADVDLAALFRPPLFRDVAPRTPAEAAAVAANAIATQVDSVTNAAEEGEPTESGMLNSAKAAIPTLDYTLAPPLPPLAPRVPVDDFDAGRLPASTAPLSTGEFGTAPEDSACGEELPTVMLSDEELQEFANQCQTWHSVELELANAEDFGSPEEAHVMVVDRSLDPIEAAAQRERQMMLDAEINRQREEVLSTLIQQEVIVGDLPCEATWLDGSECQPSEADALAADDDTPPAGASEPSTISVAATPDMTGEFTNATLFEASLITTIAECDTQESDCQSPDTVPEVAESAGHAEPAEVDLPAIPATPEPVAETPEEIIPQVEPPVVEPPVAEEQVAETPIVEETIVAEEPMAVEPLAAPSFSEPLEHEPIVDEPIESPADSVAEEPAAAEPLSPAWEVDRIVWPAISDELLTHAREQFNAAIDKFAAAPSAKVIAVSGHDRGEGRTTLAICLARAAATLGKRVALVDADFESPGIARVLSLDTMGGWDASLVSNTPLDEAAIASIDDQLTIVPLENPISSHALPGHAAGIESVLEELAASFDLVLLDVGPARELLADGGWIRHVTSKPSLLLAHDMRSASELEVQQTIEMAAADGIDVVGVAQTFAAAEEIG